MQDDGSTRQMVEPERLPAPLQPGVMQGLAERGLYAQDALPGVNTWFLTRPMPTMWPPRESLDTDRVAWTGREDFELAQYAASNLNARNVEQARWRLLEADVSPPECGKSALVGGTRPVEDVGIGTRGDPRYYHCSLEGSLRTQTFAPAVGPEVNWHDRDEIYEPPNVVARIGTHARAVEHVGIREEDPDDWTFRDPITGAVNLRAGALETRKLATLTKIEETPDYLERLEESLIHAGLENSLEARGIELIDLENHPHEQLRPRFTGECVVESAATNICPNNLENLSALTKIGIFGLHKKLKCFEKVPDPLKSLEDPARLRDVELNPAKLRSFANFENAVGNFKTPAWDVNDDGDSAKNLVDLIQFARGKMEAARLQEQELEERARDARVGGRRPRVPKKNDEEDDDSASKKNTEEEKGNTEDAKGPEKKPEEQNADDSKKKKDEKNDVPPPEKKDANSNDPEKKEDSEDADSSKKNDGSPPSIADIPFDVRLGLSRRMQLVLGNSRDRIHRLNHERRAKAFQKMNQHQGEGQGGPVAADNFDPFDRASTFNTTADAMQAMTDSLGQLLALRQLEKAYCAEFMPEERAIYAEAGLPDPFGLPPPVQAKKK